MKRSMILIKSPKSMNVLSSEGRNQTCLDYAESRETTNAIDN